MKKLLALLYATLLALAADCRTNMALPAALLCEGQTGKYTIHFLQQGRRSLFRTRNQRRGS